MGAPLIYRWTGEAMEPTPRFMAMANREFVVGQTYLMEEVHARSKASHDHYFAQLNDSWLSLPDHEGERFPTFDHFRAHLLIKAGYATVEEIVCATKAEAQRWAANLRRDEPYALIVASGPVIRRFRAESQSKAAMGAERFQASKTAVLELASAMIGVTSEQLQHNAGKAA